MKQSLGELVGLRELSDVVIAASNKDADEFDALARISLIRPRFSETADDSFVGHAPKPCTFHTYDYFPRFSGPLLYAAI